MYGASSQSGTLRVITNKPNPKAFDAWAEAQVSNVGHGGTGHDISGMVNLPLAADRLALRLVGFSAEDAGYIDNVLGTSLGGTFTNADVVKKDVNSTKTSGGRAALRWDMSETVNATLGIVYQDTDANGHGDVDLGAGDLNQVRFEKESLNDRWYQTALTLNASLPFGDAVVSASYFDRDFRYEADASAYEFAFNQFGTPAYDFGDTRGFATDHEARQITTFEARMSSPGDSESRWAWLAGAFYSKDRAQTEFDSFVLDYKDTNSFYYFDYYERNLTGNSLPGTDRWFLGRYDTELDQVAVFGELAFDVTENFKITAGGRWFDYDRKFAQIQQQPEGFTGYTALDGNQKTKESGTAKKLNLTYKLNRDRLVYATYSEGFRVGGSNPLKPASLLPRDYRSDQIKNYEVGTKTEWLNHRLRANVSAYYMKWKDFAVQVEDPSDVFQLGFVNLPTAEIKGVESELAVTLNDEWQIDAALGWNDAKTAEASTLSVTDDTGTVFTFAVSKGARLPLTPDWSGAFGIEYRPGRTLFASKPYARFDYAYVGGSVNSLAGIESVVSGHPVDRQEAYQTGNLRFGLEGEHWSGSLFVDNLWDERADLFRNNRWGLQRESINTPRTVGVQFRYSFSP